MSVAAPTSGFGWLRRSTPSAPTTPEFPAGALQALIVLQRADGSWDLDRRFADAIGRTLRDMQLVIAAAQGSDEDVRRAWATALALAWLRKYAAGREDDWRMLSQKAEKWLHGVAAILPGRWTWFDRAEAFLRE